MTTKPEPTIVITGASGFLGSHLVDHFAQKGWHVRALVRNPKKYPKKTGVTYYDYDLTKPFADSIFKKADYLVHAAYSKHSRQNPDALAINVAAAERLLEASRSHRLKKNVFVSTMSAHKEAVSIYGRQKLTIEKLFDEKNDVVLRSGLIIGDGGIVKEMVSFMRGKHLVPLVDGGRQPLQVIAIYDLVQTIEKALTSRAQGLFTVATPKIYSYKDFYRILARAANIRIFFISLPFWLLLGIMRLISLLPLPLNIGEDNLWGLKQLRSAKTQADLKKLGVSLDDLETILQRPGILS